MVWLPQACSHEMHHLCYDAFKHQVSKYLKCTFTVQPYSTAATLQCTYPSKAGDVISCILQAGKQLRICTVGNSVRQKSTSESVVVKITISALNMLTRMYGCEKRQGSAHSIQMLGTPQVMMIHISQVHEVRGQMTPDSAISQNTGHLQISIPFSSSLELEDSHLSTERIK